jgi:hypothetical protein
MNQMSLRRMLHQTFLDELDALPDAGHTAACLELDEARRIADGVLQLAAERAPHVGQCAWCQRALRAFRETVPVTTTSLQMAQWPTEFLARLEEWVRAAAAREQAGATVAHFDDAGSLRVRWEHLPQEGTVSLYLIWEEQELLLAQGTVTGGVLTIDDQHPALPLTNLDVPAALLRLRPEPVSA